MTSSITPKQIRATNRQMIYNHIYQEGKVSQQDLSYALHLSRPTVASNLVELEADGLIYKNGQLDSELIGRKAVAYSIVAAHRAAVGVSMTRRSVEMAAADLYGREIGHMALHIPYADSARYYEEIGGAIARFIEQQPLGAGQILGVGFATQGLVSGDGKTLVYGAILRNTGLTIDALARHLPCPCTFIHDAECAALSELWSEPALSNAIFLSLSRHLGGAMITNGQVRAGKHGHNATFEHITVRPKGELCYCGKRGCVETLCSMKALLGDGDPAPFFEAVRSGSSAEKRRWRTYLTHLAKLISGLHLVRDVDIILGGQLGAFLTEEDVRFLYREIRELTPFDEADDYIHISRMPSHSITVGAALFYIRGFLKDIDRDIDTGSGA